MTTCDSYLPAGQDMRKWWKALPSDVRARRFQEAKVREACVEAFLARAAGQSERAAILEMPGETLPCSPLIAAAETRTVDS